MFQIVTFYSMITCKHCNQRCCKKGVRQNGTQKYQCISCKKYSQAQYRYVAYETNISGNIIDLNNEGMGIRSIARFL